METLYVLIAFLIGGVLGFLLAKLILKPAQVIDDKALLEVKSLLELQIANLKTELSEWQSKFEKASRELSSSENEVKNLTLKLNEQKAELLVIQTQMQKDFAILADKILDEKSQKFIEKNDQQLKGILDPLKERLKQYEDRVDVTHRETERERSAMKEQLKMLTDMNVKMSQEALNLTRALKGDTKTQGNWGELILEKILEKSGLEKGREYDVQQNFTAENGQRSMPDVIIRLPDGKNLIIDSKVSLVAYEKYMSSDNEAEREVILKEHVLSLRGHVKNLSSKSYHQLYNINSPDFVLLFVPIESAFALAVSANNDLYNEAFDKNIIIVSTSTLLATLRTIANVWKQEYQSQNAMEIARQGADLYEKFVAFTDDLIKVGKKMDESKEQYSEAMKKLSAGRGNLINRAENMKKLGLKVDKQITQSLIERSEKQND
jgi:DNA recombination protein RmuC